MLENFVIWAVFVIFLALVLISGGLWYWLIPMLVLNIIVGILKFFE